MSVSWSEFGLEEPAVIDRDRLVILGGGRGLVLGVSWNKSWPDGTLDDRFYVAWSQLKPDSLLPTRGDIVLWRGYSPADPDNWAYWAAPSRVLRVERHDDRIDVWSLEDIDLYDRVDADDLNHSFVEHDRVLTERELWSELPHWGVNPCCPRCGGELLPIMYGMPLGDPGPGVILGGCVITPNDPTAQCTRCRYQEMPPTPGLPWPWGKPSTAGLGGGT